MKKDRYVVHSGEENKSRSKYVDEKVAKDAWRQMIIIRCIVGLLVSAVTIALVWLCVTTISVGFVQFVGGVILILAALGTVPLIIGVCIGLYDGYRGVSLINTEALREGVWEDGQ